MKQCSKCKTKKDLTEFYKRTASNDGLYPTCISCRREYRKMYYQVEAARKKAEDGLTSQRSKY